MKKSSYNKVVLTLWIVFQIGPFAALFAQDNWINYTIENTPMSDHHINDIVVIDELKWVGTNWGLYTFDNTSWLDFSEFLPNNSVQSLSLDNNGMLYVGTLGGLAIYDGINWSQITPENSLLPGHINAVVFDENNTGFIGTIDGLYKMEGDVFSLVLDSSSLEPNFVNVRSLAFKGDSLCIGTINGGLAYLFNDNIIWFNTTNGLIDNTITDLSIKDENVWLSCPYGGLVNHLVSGSFITFNSGFFPNWPSNSLNCLLVDDEVIYVGTNEAGFFEFTYENGIQNTIVYNTQNSELINNTVLCIEKDNDSFWIGTQEGLVHWSKSNSIFNGTSQSSNYDVNHHEILFSKKTRVELYSIEGKLLFQNQNTSTLDTRSFSRGFYILHFDSKTERLYLF